MTQWKKVLKSLGFSDSEAVIYLTSLEIGPASVQDLAKKSKVSRVTTYAVIESLADRSLMSSVEKGKKRLFVAESPERLVSFVHGRVKEMEATLKEVESSMQELKLVQRGEKPVVKMFEGHEALKAIQEDILRTRPKQLDEFGNFDLIDKLYTEEHLVPFYNEMAKFKPNIRAIFSVKEQMPKTRHGHEQIMTIETDKPFFGDLAVYDDKVAFSTLSGKHISVLIESGILADTVRALLDLVWKKK